jgi:hypothetical protein
MKPPMNRVALALFLATAHRRTYADKTAAKVPPSRAGSVDYHYQEGRLAYHDTYFGVRDYIGAEIVYQGDAPIWGMNYFGVILAADAVTAEVYGFLREALMQDCRDIEPARGPRFYQHERWRYENEVDGKLGDFRGTELIHIDGRVVYRCHYHGGYVV